MHRDLQSAFSEAANVDGAVLANVGEAFFESDDAGALYGLDGVHPSEKGVLLAADVLATVIRG